MTDRFGISQTPIQGLVLIERKPRGDQRGYLERLFCTEEFRGLLPDGAGIEQINRTLTVDRGTVRGLHFQYPPHAEIKIVHCLHGQVFDVAVDLRKSSPTFLNWHAEILTSGNHRSMLIPEGFAHGFQALTDDVQMLYFHTAAYHPAAEGGLNVRDPLLNIQWPEPLTHFSDRDASHPMLDDQFTGLDT